MTLNIKAVSIDKDDRLSSYCVTCKCTYNDFLSLTAGAEENLQIQRGFIKGVKAYATLRADLKRGCVLPPIVLAANIKLDKSIEEIVKESDFELLSNNLSNLESNNVYVIDGLQRTNAIRQTVLELDSEGEKNRFLNREIRLEIWININFGAVAYRMLLLNAGQRPMSVKHQVEVLSSKLLDELSGINGLDIFRISDQRRRSQPGQFKLSNIAQSFQAWLQGHPNLDLRNTVMEELLAESAIDVLGHTVNGNNNGGGFNKFAEWLVEFDIALGSNNVSFLGAETVILGLSAAVGALERSETLGDRVWPALNKLLNDVRESPEAAGLTTFDKVRSGIDPTKSNVGSATKEMIFSAFKEYIREKGQSAMSECWLVGAAQV